jgi:trehalose synthase
LLQLVDVGRRSINAYKGVVEEGVIEELRRLAAPLKGVKVAHINATPYGGGVSELLRSLVPLENDLGVDAEWRIIFGRDPFFRVTKTFHDALQGAQHRLTSDEKDTYVASNYANSRELNPADYDIVVIHDPQPAAMLESVRHQARAKWIWRCHIDTSHPNLEVWDYLRDYVELYHHAVFTMQEFIPPGFSRPAVTIIPPAIDPLSPKNMDLSPGMATEILSWLGMFPGDPFITQVSRFDKWKDPFGVIKSWQLAREEVPDLHLALVGSMALDDPTGWDIYKELTDLDQEDPDLHVFTNLTGVSNIEVNAFQRFSKAVIQKSVREGFGLVVSEALWKGTPVIAGRAGGIPMQLSQGGGYLVDSTEECAAHIVELFKHPELAKSMGDFGHANVMRNFLITRLLRDELALFQSVLGL